MTKVNTDRCQLVRSRLLTIALMLMSDAAWATVEIPSQQLLGHLNVYLSQCPSLSGCEFPRVKESKLTRAKRAIRGTPLSPMERKFAIPSREDTTNWTIYESLRKAGFIVNNDEPSEIDSVLRPTFSLTMKGWQAFPLNRGGQQTCIKWRARELASSIVRIDNLPDDSQVITYEAERPKYPDWLPEALRTRSSHTSKTRSISLDPTTEEFSPVGSKRRGGPRSYCPAEIRARFPSDDKVIEMAQSILDLYSSKANQPCVNIDAGSVDTKNVWGKQPGQFPAFYFSSSIEARHHLMLQALTRHGYLQELKLDRPVTTSKGLAEHAFQATPAYMDLVEPNTHNTCIRYGTSVAQKVVATPDGQAGYTQYFVVWYAIEDVKSWANLPGVSENLPESARLCLEHGSLIEVRDGGGGGLYGCSLP